MKVMNINSRKITKFPVAMVYKDNTVVVFVSNNTGFAVQVNNNEHPIGEIVTWDDCNSPIWREWHGDINLRF